MRLWERKIQCNRISLLDQFVQASLEHALIIELGLSNVVRFSMVMAQGLRRKAERSPEREDVNIFNSPKKFPFPFIVVLFPKRLPTNRL